MRKKMMRGNQVRFPGIIATLQGPFQKGCLDGGSGDLQILQAGHGYRGNPIALIGFEPDEFFRFQTGEGLPQWCPAETETGFQAGYDELTVRWQFAVEDRAAKNYVDCAALRHGRVIPNNIKLVKLYIIA